MTQCRAGLVCRLDACRDLENPTILDEGERCSEARGGTATGFLGSCADGLVCDSSDTRTCIPDPHWPRVPVGGECTNMFDCEDGSFCKGPGDISERSEDSPGVCTLPAIGEEPCIFPYDCRSGSCDDGVCEAWPSSPCQWLDKWLDSH